MNKFTHSTDERMMAAEYLRLILGWSRTEADLRATIDQVMSSVDGIPFDMQHVVTSASKSQIKRIIAAVKTIREKRTEAL